MYLFGRYFKVPNLPSNLNHFSIPVAGTSRTGISIHPRKSSWPPDLADCATYVQFFKLWMKKSFWGCRHSSVDSSASSILPPQVRVPSSPPMLLPIKVKFVICLSLHCEQNKNKQKEVGFGPFKKVFLTSVYYIAVSWSHFLYDLHYLCRYSVWPEKIAKCISKLPKNDFTRKMKDVDTFTKIA